MKRPPLDLPERPRRASPGSTALLLGLGLGLGLGWCPAVSTAQDVPGTTMPTSDPVRSEIELNRGIVAFEQNRFGEALERLANVEPAEAGAGTSYYRGLSLLALRRAGEALTQLERVNRTPGAPAEAGLDLAVAQLGVGDAAKAQATLEEYLKSNPGDPYGHYFLGVALFRQKEYQPAIAQLDSVADDARFAPYLDFYKGLTSYAEGDGQHRGFLDRYQA